MAELLKQKKRQKVLIGILIAVIIISALVWYSYLRKKPSDEEFLLMGEQRTINYSFTEERIAKVKLDISVLNDSVFKSLKSHGILPVTAGKTGRENPFESY